MLHEQNAVLGRVNRLLTPRVDAIALSFESTVGLRAEDESKRSVTGNPVRPAIVAVRELAYVPPNGEGPLRLLRICFGLRRLSGPGLCHDRRLHGGGALLLPYAGETEKDVTAHHNYPRKNE